MLKNTALSSILVNIPVQILSFLGGILTVRLLGPDFKGVQAFILANMEFLGLILGFSMENTITYFISNEKLPKEKVISIGFFIACTGSILAMLIFLVGQYGFDFNIIHYNQKWVNILVIGYFLVAVSQGLFYSVVRGYLLGIGQIVALNRFTLLFAVSRFLMLAILFGFYYGTEPSYEIFLGVIGLDLGVLLLTSIIMIGVYRKYASGIRISFLSLTWKKHLYPYLRFASTNHFGILLNFLNYRLDVWLLAYFLPGQDDEIGFYYMAVMLAQLLWIIPNGILTKAFQDICSNRDYKVAVSATRSNMALLLIAIAIGASIGPFLIPVLYGVEFAEAIPAFLIMLGAIFWNSLTKTSAMFHYSKNNVHLNVWATTFGVVVTLVLNILLIPDYGILGAAISSLACYFVIFWSTFLFFRREIKKEGVNPNNAFKMFVPGLSYLTKRETDKNE